MPKTPIVRAAVWAASATTTAVTASLGGLGALAWWQAKYAVDTASEGRLDHRSDGSVGPCGHERPRRVVWIGDSLAAGYGAISPDVSLPRLVASQSDRSTRIHVLAEPGHTSADVVETQLSALDVLRHGLAEIGESVDAIGVSVGGNDIAALTSMKRFRRNIREILDATEGLPTVVMGIPSLHDAIRLPHPLRDFADLQAGRYRRVVRSEIAERDNVQYVSVHRRPAWLTREHLPNFLAPDRFHPNGAGYAIFADRVAEAFDRVLAPQEPALATA